MADPNLLKLIREGNSNDNQISNVSADNLLNKVIERMGDIPNVTQEQIENFKKLLGGGFSIPQASFFANYAYVIFIALIILIILIFGCFCYKLYRCRREREHQREIKRMEKEMRKIK